VLAEAEQVPRPTQLEVALRNLKAVVGARKDLQFGFGGERVLLLLLCFFLLLRLCLRLRLSLCLSLLLSPVLVQKHAEALVENFALWLFASTYAAPDLVNLREAKVFRSVDDTD